MSFRGALGCACWAV